MRISQRLIELVVSERVAGYMDSRPDGYKGQNIIADIVVDEAKDSVTVTLFGPSPGECPTLIKSIADSLDSYVGEVTVACMASEYGLNSICPTCFHPLFVNAYHSILSGGYFCIAPPSNKTMRNALKDIQMELNLVANKPPPVVYSQPTPTGYGGGGR